MDRLLCYCGNVHKARNLLELLHSIESGPGAVRQALGAERLSYGLWLSETALAESASENHQRLKRTLEKQSIDIWTMNAFPQGDFQADVVKSAVYLPNWSSTARVDYTLQCAQLLSELLGPLHKEGTISTLPLGTRDDFRSLDNLNRACENLCRVALALDQLQEQQGKRIRICLEPEPGCYLERGSDFIDFWQGPLSVAASKMGAELAVEDHLGMCLDTCHHALMFEDSGELMLSLSAAKIPIGKIQLSSAVELNPQTPEHLSELCRLDENRFLHQLRTRIDGKVIGCEDICDADTLPLSDLWRVHFHLPIHRTEFSGLGTTQSFMREIAKIACKSDTTPHFEVETYTWNVMPLGERPSSASGLATCIAEELRYAQELVK